MYSAHMYEPNVVLYLWYDIFMRGGSLDWSYPTQQHIIRGKAECTSRPWLARSTALTALAPENDFFYIYIVSCTRHCLWVHLALGFTHFGGRTTKFRSWRRDLPLYMSTNTPPLPFYLQIKDFWAKGMKSMFCHSHCFCQISFLFLIP